MGFSERALLRSLPMTAHTKTHLPLAGRSIRGSEAQRSERGSGGGPTPSHALASTPRHFLDLADFSPATLAALIADARVRKSRRVGLPKGAPDADAPLVGRVLALIFDKHSTRTRISFDVAMR